MEWASVLAAMVNLWCLGIAPGLPLARDAISTLPFRLACFHSVGAVGGSWSEFVAFQGRLDRLYLDSEFWGRHLVPIDCLICKLLKAALRTPLGLPRCTTFRISGFLQVCITVLTSLTHPHWLTGAPFTTQTLSPSDIPLIFVNCKDSYPIFSHHCSFWSTSRMGRDLHYGWLPPNRTQK
jgi:hypothetical protein